MTLITVRATDPHGYYTDAFITILIQDYQVMRRKTEAFKGKYPDVNIYEHRRFVIPLSKSVFYTILGSDTLVFFASDMADITLPSWIKFNPVSLTFSGIAPEAYLTIPVQIRAMN